MFDLSLWQIKDLFEYKEIVRSGCTWLYILSLAERSKNLSLRLSFVKCDVCDKMLSLKGGLKNHLTKVHEGKRPYKCNICLANFTSKNQLNKHIKTINKGEKPFKCTFCESNFTEKAAFRHHTTSIHKRDGNHINVLLVI